MIPMKKLPVNQLKIGMKVVKIDKKWLDTSFLKHSFVIKSEKELLQLRNTCEFVFVEHKQSAIEYEKNTESPESLEKKGVKTIEKSFKLLNVIFNDLEKSSYLNSVKIKEVVNSLTIQVLADTKTHEYLSLIQLKSPGIAQKSLRVMILYLTFCKYIGIKKDKLLNLGCAALLHDIGMIELPIDFDKPDKITYLEKQHLYTHTKLGVAIIEKSAQFPELVSRIIQSHHEHYNGSGYPDGLAQRDINLYSRILTLVCAYEAITRNRGYQKALNSYSAMSQLANVSGTMLDPRLVARFIEIIREFPVGTRIMTVKDEHLIIVAKVKGRKYQVMPISSENSDSSFILDSNVIKEVIYD
jgi:putative nucleotidyltransferase with HDIG domain